MAQINKPGLHFNTNLYTGNNSNTAHTGIGFQPDFVWLKVRNASGAHYLFDAVRGANKDINSNDDSAEYTATQNLMSFDSDGYTVGTSNSVNTNGETMVGWNWKANGAGSANTDGSITSTVSANTTAGFSIVSYTGNGSTNQTIGHGLGAIPDFIIVKQRNTSRNWPTYTKALGNGVAFLDVTDAWNGGGSYQNYWYVSGMTTSTFGISNNNNTNASSGTFIAYCFAEKKGYSKFGSYTGNGNADGTFVYTGMKPSFILLKMSSGTGSWNIFDNKRDTFNPTSKRLVPNLSNAEADTSTQAIDFLSNGFKLKSNNTDQNGSGSTYIYMAFAENPIVGSNNVAAVAR